MQHRGSSAALVNPDPTFGFWRHAGGLQRLLLMQGFRFLHLFHALFGFNAALPDSYDPFSRSLAAAAPHGWTPAFHAHATSCEQRSCTRDTSKQVLRRSLAALHEDKERRLSPLNEPVDFLNLAMIFPLDLRYGFP